MGSLPTKPGHRADEGPVDVTLSRGFWAGKYEVTQGQWRRIMGAIPGLRNAGDGDDFPVYNVNFVQAEQFCRALTERARSSWGIARGMGVPPAH